MSKTDLIAAIREHNPSADEHFLNAFNEPTLQTYLDRLTKLQGHRGRGSTWIRQATTPAVTHPNRAA